MNDFRERLLILVWRNHPFEKGGNKTEVWVWALEKTLPSLPSEAHLSEEPTQAMFVVENAIPSPARTLAHDRRDVRRRAWFGQGDQHGQRSVISGAQARTGQTKGKRLRRGRHGRCRRDRERQHRRRVDQLVDMPVAFWGRFLGEFLL